VINTVLFDLDGTVSDSAPGILSSLEKAFADMGVPWLEPVTARSLLGPPFWSTLGPYVGSDRVEEAVERYREHYVDHGAMFDTVIYPGIRDTLEWLSGAGRRMAVATSKPETHAAEIVAHLGIADYFVTVCGDTLDGSRRSKALVVGEVLRRLGDPDPAEVLMVGDRSHDVLGAAAHDVRCAGALWGYGTAEELSASGAIRLCSTPAELLQLIG
jgi:phosphoglycolate phosphatase